MNFFLNWKLFCNWSLIYIDVLGQIVEFTDYKKRLNSSFEGEFRKVHLIWSPPVGWLLLLSDVLIAVTIDWWCIASVTVYVTVLMTIWLILIAIYIAIVLLSRWLIEATLLIVVHWTAHWLLVATLILLIVAWIVIITIISTTKSLTKSSLKKKFN